MKLVMRQRIDSSFVGTQRTKFVEAVLTLKATPITSTDPTVTNAYDQFVAAHRDTEHIQPDGRDFNDAHRGPAFFPWHRQFLKEFEEWLQWASGDETMGLPYWDWSRDPFPNTLLGGDGSGSDGKVMDGDFAYDARKKGDPRKWTLNVRIVNEEPTLYLKRRFGKNTDPPVSTLPSEQDVYATLNLSPYDVDPWDDTSGSGFRNTAEGFILPTGFEGAGMHNRVHLWVGGSMIPMTSPNDPVFFVHHCFVDKLWADWQPRHRDQQRYLPADGARKGHNLNDPMPPWTNVTPKQMLYHRALGYRYDTENYLLRGEELYPGQWIWSSDKSYYLLYASDAGNLRLIRSGDAQPLWQSPNPSRPLGRCIMREDGNLLIYHPSAGPYDPNPIWQSGTAGHPGGFLSVQRSGYVGLFPGGGAPSYWSKP